MLLYAWWWLSCRFGCVAAATFRLFGFVSGAALTRKSISVGFSSECLRIVVTEDALCMLCTRNGVSGFVRADRRSEAPALAE
jgi:hypothetical protein